jgi:hypothetical protein
MSAYTDDQERGIRVGRLVQDWARSGLLSEEQRDRIMPELKVDLRRTNVFLRGTLFLFTLLIVQSMIGLVMIAIGTTGDEAIAAVLLVIGSAANLALANVLVRRFRLYRFGVEEAMAVASAIFAVAAAVFAVIVVVGPGYRGDAHMLVALSVGAAMSLALFLHFGFVYAAIAAMVLAACVPFVPGDNDAVHRVLSAAVLATVFAVARAQREEHGREFPGDNYAIIEAAAWIGIYLVINLPLSSWLSHWDERTPFYWGTYAATWMLPIAGLWIAVRDRHRLLLDANIVMVIVTLSTNKEYLGSPRQPYDPIAFGVLLIAVAVGLRRWLASGADGSRNGFIAERILESEKERLGVVGTLSVVHQGPVASHPQPEQPPPPAIGGGGTSGGGGATGSF